MDRYPFEVFTDDAKRVLGLSVEEAESRRSGHIGTEHLLLGILRLRAGSAYRALLYLDVDERAMRSALNSALSAHEPSAAGAIPTMKVKTVVEIAFEEARRMATPNIHSAHLLMGLVKEGTGTASVLLRERVAAADVIIAAAERQLM